MKQEYLIFENNVIQKFCMDYKYKKIKNRFFSKNNDIKLEEKHIMFWPFVNLKPFKYIKPEAYNKLSSFLADNIELSIDSILEHRSDMTKAILTYHNMHIILNNEENISELTSETINNFDTVYNFEYLKNTEHVYGRLINIITTILGKINEKDYKSQTNISSKLNILRKYDFEILTECCNPVIRNAISHGAVYYETNTIIFIDSHGREEISPNEYIMIIDDLLDTCASILLAFIVFILDTDKILLSSDIPDGIIFIYLSSLLGYEHFKFENILPNSLGENKKQIAFFIKTDSNSRKLHQFESIKLAYFLNTRFNHNYSRIVININSGKSIIPAMFIDLNKLKLAMQNKSLRDIGKSIDASLLWYDENKIQQMMWFYKNYYHYNKEKIKNDFLNTFYNARSINYYGDKYYIKKIEDRSSERAGRIFIHAVINTNDLFNNIENIIDMILHIIKTHKKQRKLKICKGLSDKTKYTKPIYIWGSLYKQDNRARNIRLNKNKICDFEWVRNTKKYNPILLKEINEIRGIRIKFEPV
ncbi:MAG: hypothetical protein FWD47_13785 [Treponema sp.]|nr:hypothetical protein [Treponema sp.]